MAKEIERKFLIDLTKIGPLVGGTVMKQGYIKTVDLTTVRARIAGEKAFLTLKGANRGMTRTEFEYEIPIEDAEGIIAELCSGPVVEKTRYEINHAGHIWEVDIFHGDNEGLTVAEIELADENEQFEKPSWVNSEVTGDVKYYNANLLENPFKDWLREE